MKRGNFILHTLKLHLLLPQNPVKHLNVVLYAPKVLLLHAQDLVYIFHSYPKSATHSWPAAARAAQRPAPVLVPGGEPRARTSRPSSNNGPRSKEYGQMEY